MDLDSGEMIFTAPWHDGSDGFSDINNLDHFVNEFDDLDSFDSEDF